MIRNLEKQDHWALITDRVMLIIARVLKSQTKNSILLAIASSFLTVLSTQSVLFIGDPLQPQPANQMFRFFVISHLPGLLNIEYQIVLAVLVALNFVTLILVAFNAGENPFTFAVKGLSLVLTLVKVLAVPLFFFWLQNMTTITTQWQTIATSQALLRILYTIATPLTLFLLTIFISLSICPLRSSNMLWNYNNHKQLAHYTLALFRAVVLYFDSSPMIVLVVSLWMEVQVYQMPASFLCEEMGLVERWRHGVCCVVGAGLVCGAVLGDGTASFVVFAVGSGFYTGLCLLEGFAIFRRTDRIPECKFQNARFFYSFYMHLNGKNKNSMEDLLRTLKFHQLQCYSEDCVFKQTDLENSSNKITVQDIEQKITKFLKSFRYQTPESQLMYQLWKIELNKTITLSYSLRQFSLQHKFIIHYALGTTETSSKQQLVPNSSTALNISSESTNGRWKFYQQLSNAVQQFQLLGEVLCKPLPSLSEVIDALLGINRETNALNALFEEIINSKDINYTCIQLYLKYFDCFLAENKLPNEILDKLKRLKILTVSDSIQENPMPCFIIDACTQSVQKVNAQVLKFLKCYRHQIKDKNFSSLVFPALSGKQFHYYYTHNQKQQPLPIFFKIRSSSPTSPSLAYTCRSIKLKQIQINNKNYYQIEVFKKSNINSLVEMIIDQQNQLVACSEEEILIGYRGGKRVCRVADLYQEKIRGIVGEIFTFNVGRIEFEDPCMVSGIVGERNCPYNGFRLLSLTLIKKITNTRSNKRTSQARLSKLYNTHTEFNFSYKFDEAQNTVLQGSHIVKKSNESIINENQSMRTLNDKLMTYIADIANERFCNYSAGIKVYRLYEGDLYNIDLEDRTKYEEQFDNAQERVKFGSQKLLNCKINQACLIAVLVLLAAAVTGCSLFLCITSDQQFSAITSEEIKMLYIQEFSLNYNRIMATLRDVASGLFAQMGLDYADIVFDSYGELQKYDSSQFLSEKTQTGVYEGQTYRGSLSELIEVSLTHVYEFMQTSDHEIIELIHDYALTYLGPLLAQEKLQRKEAIKEGTKRVGKFTILGFLFIGTGSLLYFFIFIVLSQQFKKNLSAFLDPLLMTSESDVKHISEQCQKFQNIILNLYKNYEIDIGQIEDKKKHSKKRIRPKRVDSGICTLMTEILTGGLIVGLLLGLAFLQFNITNQEVVHITNLFAEADAVVEVYSGLSWTTNQMEHLGITPYEDIEALNKNLDLIEDKKNHYQFSDEVTQFVKTIYFTDSCQYLTSRNIIKPKWCGNSMVGFLEKDPFHIGLDLYFRRMNYYVIANLSNTFASNGIYSEPFKQTFKSLSIKIRTEIQQKMTNIRSTLLSIGILVTALSFMLISLLLISMAYFRTKLSQITKSLVNIVGDYQNRRIVEDTQKIADGGGVDDSSIAERVEESDYLIVGQDAHDQVREQ